MMMMMKIQFRKMLWILGLLILFVACGKKDAEQVAPEPEEPETPKPPTPDPPKFYYVGYQYAASYKAKEKNAILSIGDSLVQLSPKSYSDAVAVSVLNKTVHITGYQHVSATTRRIAYWKNKTLTLYGKAGTFNIGTAILAQGSKVYVAGNSNEEVGSGLYMWVNGKMERLACCLANSDISGIALLTGEPVLAGRFTTTASMWVGDSMLALANSNSNADYIKTINKDIYVLGYRSYNSSSDAAAVWKNDVEIFTLPLGKSVTNVMGTMVGSDYYFVVNYYDSKGKATVYKNKTKLYDLNPAQSLEANAIQVVGGKVYVLGNTWNGTKSSAILWTDGKGKVLFNEAKRIYLKDFVIQ